MSKNISVKILDSGDRHEFSTGAVRDMREGKGRCDLIPLTVVSDFFDGLEYDNTILSIANFIDDNNTRHLYAALLEFAYAA